MTLCFSSQTIGFWESCLARFRMHRRGELPDQWEIEASESGFCVKAVDYRGLQGRKHEWQVPWCSVRHVAAFRLSEFVVDTVWIRVLVAKPGAGSTETVSFPDEAVGWGSFVAELPALLPGSLPSGAWLPRALGGHVYGEEIEIYSGRAA